MTTKAQMNLIDPKSKNTIKRKLQISIAAFSTVITLLFGTVNSIIIYQDARNNMQLRIQKNTNAYNHSVENAILIYKTKIESVSMDNRVTGPSGTSEQLKENLAQLAEKYGFDSIIICDPQGITSDGSDVSDREYFKRSINGETYISSPIFSKTTGKMIMVLTAPINGDGSKGIVSAILCCDSFSKMINDISLGKSGYGFIVDKAGTVIAHKDQENVNQQLNYIEAAKTDSSFSETAKLVQNMTAGMTGFESIHLKGSQFTVGYAPIPNTDGWSIGVAANTTELMEGFYISIFIMIFFIIVFLIIALICAIRIASPIVNPIIKMVDRLELLSRGDLHSQVPEYVSDDEIGTL